MYSNVLEKYPGERAEKELAQIKDYYEKNIKNNPKAALEFLVSAGIVDKKGKPTIHYRNLFGVK